MNFVFLIKAKDEKNLKRKMEKFYIHGSGNCKLKYIKLIDCINEKREEYEVNKKTNENFFDYLYSYGVNIINIKDYNNTSEHILKEKYEIMVVDDNKNVLKFIKVRNPNGILDSYGKCSLGEGFFKLKDDRIIASNLRNIEGMERFDRLIPNINELYFEDPDWKELYFNNAIFLYEETKNYYKIEAEKDYEKYKKICVDSNFLTLDDFLIKNEIKYEEWEKIRFSKNSPDIIKKIWDDYRTQDFIKILREDYKASKVGHFIFYHPECIKNWTMEKYIEYKAMNTLNCYKFYDKKIYSSSVKQHKNQSDIIEEKYQWVKKVDKFINNGSEKDEKLFILNVHS